MGVLAIELASHLGLRFVFANWTNLCSLIGKCFNFWLIVCDCWSSKGTQTETDLRKIA